MRFIGDLSSECPRDERAPRHICRPRFGQRTCEGEQHWTLCKRDHRVCVTNAVTIRIHDERFRRQQRFNFLEQERSRLAARKQTRRGLFQDERCAFDLRRQRGDTRVACGVLGPRERSARRLHPQTSNCDPRNDQLVGGPQCRWERRRVELGERAFGFVETPDQEEAPHLEIARMCCIHAVAVLFERHPRCVERLRRPGEVARGKRDLGLGDHALRASHGLFPTKGSCGTTHQNLRSSEIAELRHRDASKRERRRVVTQGDPLQCAERITRCECARRGRNQRVHLNPAKLVTPTVRTPGANLSHDELINDVRGEPDMTDHRIVDRREWTHARTTLLAREKEFTRLRDELAQARRELPWERVDKSYEFEGARGRLSLGDLFGARRQLVVYHFMFAPEWETGCKSCSFWADNFNGIVPHLQQRDVSFAAISRAPYAKLQAFAQRLGWTFEWVSCAGNSFNHDYQVSFVPEELAGGKPLYNYGSFKPKSSDMPGISVFYRETDGGIFHTYSTFGRGIDMMNTAYQYLDLVPKGRDESSGQHPMSWVRLHDSYAA